MTMFHVGMMVVAIGMERGQRRACARHILRGSIPVKGQVYTIRGFDPGWPMDDPGLYLEEVVCISGKRGYETSWDWRNFRPVKTTDISELRRLVIDAPKEVVSA